MKVYILGIVNVSMHYRSLTITYRKESIPTGRKRVQTVHEHSTQRHRRSASPRDAEVVDGAVFLSHQEDGVASVKAVVKAVDKQFWRTSCLYRFILNPL